MINMLKKQKAEEPEKNMLKDAYFNERVKMYTGVGSKEPSAYVFTCTRCGTNCSGSDIQVIKNTFDYYLITDYILCDKCIDEIEHMKENPYKVRVEVLYAHERGDVSSVVEDVKPNMDEVYKFIEATDKEVIAHALGMGYMIKDRKYYI